MASLRLLAVLSVVALLHSTVLAHKCEQWQWSRVGNGPIVIEQGKASKEVDCAMGWCYTSSVVTAGSQKITYFADCHASDRTLQQTVPYECSAPQISGTETALLCYCKATSGSACNSRKLMFDPEGDAGQKTRALELRKMGIIAERKNNKDGQPEIDIQYFTCEDWHMEFRPTTNNELTGKTSKPCKGVCGMNINRMDAEKGVNVLSTCWAYANQALKCYYADGTEKNMVCYCAGSDCNSAARLFDPKGDADQKARLLQIRKMGVIAEWKTISAGQPEIGFQYFSCENWNMKFRPTGNTEQIVKQTVLCKFTCSIKIVRKEAEKGVDVSSNCWDHHRDHGCTAGEDDSGKNMECNCIESDCNSAARLFDPEGDAEQKSRALELRKIGVIAEVKQTGAGREITYKFDDDLGKTTVEPAATTQAADDPATDDGLEDAATGLSLAFAVVLTILRLI